MISPDIVAVDVKYAETKLSELMAKTQSINKININEYETGGFSWTSGTYTIVADVKIDGAATISNDSMTTIDGLMNEPGEWDRVTYEYVGTVSKATSDSGEPYGSLVIGFATANRGVPFAIDNLKVYFKTDATTITLKNGGNSNIGDVVAENVSTTDGITVAELIELVKAEDSDGILLGISETPTGNLLDPETVIVPAYPMTLYTVWKTKTSNPYVDANLGQLLFSVDFENPDVLDANWNGYGQLDNTSNLGNGDKVQNVASYYNEKLLGKTNTRALFRVNLQKNTMPKYLAQTLFERNCSKILMSNQETKNCLPNFISESKIVLEKARVPFTTLATVTTKSVWHFLQNLRKFHVRRFALLWLLHMKNA